MTRLKVAHQLTGMFQALSAVGQPCQYVELKGTSAGACVNGITGRSRSQIARASWYSALHRVDVDGAVCSI